MIEKDFYEEAEVLEFLGIAKSTLQKYRGMGKKHPPCKKVFGRYVYPKKEFKRWFDEIQLRSEVAACGT